MWPPGERILAGQKFEIQRGAIHLGRNSRLPDSLALGGVGKRKFDHEAQPAQERLVQILAPVRGENREAAKALHALEQIS